MQPVQLKQNARLHYFISLCFQGAMHFQEFLDALFTCMTGKIRTEGLKEIIVD